MLSDIYLVSIGSLIKNNFIETKPICYSIRFVLFQSDCLAMHQSIIVNNVVSIFLFYSQVDLISLLALKILRVFLSFHISSRFTASQVEWLLINRKIPINFQMILFFGRQATVKDVINTDICNRNEKGKTNFVYK